MNLRSKLHHKVNYKNVPHQNFISISTPSTLAANNQIEGDPPFVVTFYDKSYSSILVPIVTIVRNIKCTELILPHPEDCQVLKHKGVRCLELLSNL